MRRSEARFRGRRIAATSVIAAPAPEAVLGRVLQAKLAEGVVLDLVVRERFGAVWRGEGPFGREGGAGAGARFAGCGAVVLSFVLRERLRAVRGGERPLRGESAGRVGVVAATAAAEAGVKRFLETGFSGGGTLMLGFVFGEGLRAVGRGKVTFGGEGAGGGHGGVVTASSAAVAGLCRCGAAFADFGAVVVLLFVLGECCGAVGRPEGGLVLLYATLS